MKRTPATASTCRATGHDERGFVLVAALVILVLLSVLGISAINNTITEKQISANDREANQTFYQAEGGLDLAIELLEQNINCPTGFGSISLNTNPTVDNVLDYIFDPGPAAGPNDDRATLGYDPNNRITVTNLDFYLNDTPSLPSDSNRDAFVSATASGTHGNFTYSGQAKTAAGNSMQMAAGYEGRGKGAAGGGVIITYDVYSQSFGITNSQSTVSVQWRHVVGLEDACLFAP